MDEHDFDELMTLSRANAEHIRVLNEETGELRDAQKAMAQTLGEVATEQVRQGTDLRWMKKIGFALLAALLALASGIGQELFKRFLDLLGGK